MRISLEDAAPWGSRETLLNCEVERIRPGASERRAAKSKGKARTLDSHGATSSRFWRQKSTARRGLVGRRRCRWRDARPKQSSRATPCCAPLRAHRNDSRPSHPMFNRCLAARSAHAGRRPHGPVLAQPSRRPDRQATYHHAHWSPTTRANRRRDRQGFDAVSADHRALGGAIAGRLIAYRLRGAGSRARAAASSRVALALATARPNRISAKA